MSADLDRLNAAFGDRYALERKLGEGGMATVYLARDLRNERRVALKVMRPELAATMGPDRFLQEVRVTANLQHPHILPLFDSGEADGFLYYVMPFLDGESLRERLAREGELPVTEAVKILREVADALATAHALGIVHRDVKPDNVMLSGRHATVTDFGVAKAVSEATGRHGLTSTGVALGTPAYMAPEQAAADDHVDHRADIYALGAMGYELLTGRPPFGGGTAQQVLAAQITEAPRPVDEHRPAVPEGLATVIMRCLEKKPADRWQSAEELLAHLELFQTPGSGITPAASVRGRARRRWLADLLRPRVAAPLAVAGIGLALWLASRGPSAPPAPAAGEEVSALSDSGFVILPFLNRSAVDSLQAFGAVVADYMTGQVSRNAIGWVAASQNVRELAADRPEGADAVRYFAGATGARWVVTGTYHQQGRSLVVQAEVTDGATGELVAAVGPVEGPMTDFMAPAVASAQQVLVVLARILDPNPNASPPTLAGVPASFGAYRDYVEGTELWSQGERERALELFYRALEADSTYAEALLMASTTEWNLGDIPKADSIIQVAHRYRDRMSPWDRVRLDWLQGWFDGDREAIYHAGRRLGELDPVRGAGGVACRGARMANYLRQAVSDCMKVYEGSHRKTGLMNFFWTDLLESLHLLGEHETELDRARVARRYNPSERSAFVFEVRALAALGLTADLRAVLQEARTHAADFSVGLVIREAGLEVRAHGRREEGDSLVMESLRWYESNGDTTTTGYAWSLIAAGDFGRARTFAEAGLDRNPESAIWAGLFGSAVAALGDREGTARAHLILTELEARPYSYGGAARWRALIAAQAGERDEAVRLLRAAYEEGSAYGVWLHTYPPLDSLRGYPPFERFIAPRG